MPLTTIAVDLPCEPEDVLPALERAADGNLSITRVSQLPATTGVRPGLSVSGTLPSIVGGFGLGFEFTGAIEGHETGTTVRLSLQPRLASLLLLWGAIPLGATLWFQGHSVRELLGLCALPLVVLLDWQIGRRGVTKALTGGAPHGRSPA